jgi:putative aldouronate transport system permease protein
LNEIKTVGEKTFRVVSYCLLALFSILAILPFVLILIASITDENTLIINGYSFLPAKFSGNAYMYLVNQISTIARAYGVSIFVTAIGTGASIILTPMLAYPMSRKDFKYRNVISFFVFFTMLFSGGVVPAYIMWTKVFHLADTLAALIIPNYLVTAFNVFLVKNYYTNNVPPALIESAQIDGASELRIFFKIMLPLSVPVVATVGLFTGLVYWNDWINSIYYITSPKLYSIQYYLIILMQNIQYLQSGSAGSAVGSMSIQLPATSVRMALAVIGVVPIVIIFPFFQKYFIKGVVIGAVKG